MAGSVVHTRHHILHRAQMLELRSWDTPVIRQPCQELGLDPEVVGNSAALGVLVEVVLAEFLQLPAPVPSTSHLAKTDRIHSMEAAVEGAVAAVR